MSDPLVICDNLVKIYKVADLEVVALQGLDMVVNKGDLTGVVGASGSGKTTLMSVLGGLERVSAGRVWIDGVDLLKLSDNAMNIYRREKIGFVWQQSTRNLLPYLTALENVRLPMALSGENKKAQHRRAQHLLELVGLGKRTFHRVSSLSGGEQQRVAVAIAIANQPRLLLADEPTGELDTQNAHGIYETFQRLNRELGITVIIVSHDPGIAHMVDRVIRISDGRLASETVRRPISSADESPASDDHTRDNEFHEHIVLDAAGRLQIPREFLEALDIKGRAIVKLSEDGIIIRPVESDTGRDKAMQLVKNFTIQQTRGWLPQLLQQLLDRGKRGDTPNGT